MMTMKYIIDYFSSLIVANIILFLGAADDPKVVGKLKCNVWFPLDTKPIGHWTLSGHPDRYEVKYFLR